jgi:hypothetical protein
MDIIETILEETNNGKDIEQVDIPRIKYRLNKAFAEQGNDKACKEVDKIIMRDQLLRYLFRDPNAPKPSKQPPRNSTSNFWDRD